MSRKQQPFGERSLARPDFDHQRLALRAGRDGDAFENRSFDEEMLAESLPGHAPVSL